MAFTAKLQFTGLKQVLSVLDRLKGSTARRVLRRAMQQATGPVTKTVKRMAPVRTGLLKKSIGRKVVTYSRTGTVVVIVGARSGYKTTGRGRNRKRVQTSLGAKYKQTGQNPTRYLHLVELGTRTIAPRRFMQRSLAIHRRQIERSMARLLMEGIRAEVSKGAAT